MRYLLKLSVFIFLVGCNQADSPEANSGALSLLNPEVISALDSIYSNNVANLQLDPQQPRVEQEFKLLLTLASNVTPQASELRGVDMYMGKIPVRWQRVAPGQWQASIVVGACSLAHMQWQLTVPISESGTVITLLQFQFFTQR
ncbi:MAG: hypothetical protein WEA82_10900 [Idiomarina sp.]